MNLHEFRRGLDVFSMYYADAEGYHLAAEHDQIYLYPSDSPMSEDDVATVKALGWFQEDTPEDEYSPDDGWSCFV